MATFAARLLDRVRRDLGGGGFLIIVTEEVAGPAEGVAAPEGSALQAARLALRSVR